MKTFENFLEYIEPLFMTTFPPTISHVTHISIGLESRFNVGNVRTENLRLINLDLKLIIKFY